MVRILIVEDEGIIALELKKKLEKKGYQVIRIVSSGEEAVEWVMKSRPDLVLMDIKLNGPMTGIEAAREILSRVNLPIIYLTAFSDEKILDEAKITEPFGYLVKHRYFGDNWIDIRVEQGGEIGRPSLLLLKAQEDGDEIEVHVGGKVVLVARGEFVAD